MNTAHQIPLDLAMRPAHGREDFLISPANADAVAWIDRWPDWPAPLLVISGPAASGKSHLASVWSDKADARHINPETLTKQSAQEIASYAPSLVIDGLDLWIGEREAETTLFHLYNIFKEENRTFLATSRMNPTTLDFTLPDLASRFRAAPIATIKEPDDMLLASILIKLFTDRQLTITNEILNYILPRMERSFAAAAAIVQNADKMAYSKKNKITIPLIRDVMMELQND